MMSRAVKVCTLTSHPLPYEGEEVKFGDLRSFSHARPTVLDRGLRTEASHWSRSAARRR